MHHATSARSSPRDEMSQDTTTMSDSTSVYTTPSATSDARWHAVFGGATGGATAATAAAAAFALAAAAADDDDNDNDDNEADDAAAV